MTESRRVQAIAAAAIVALLLGACGGRSVESFCETYRSESERLKEKYTARFDGAESQDPLTAMLVGVGSSVEAVGDLAVLYDRLERSAPEEIQPDVAAVRDALDTQVDVLREAGSDPLATMFGGLVTGLAAAGSDQRVSAYITDNCGA